MDNLGGRPRSLTDEKQEQLINHIAQGATVEKAAEILGISLRTVQREAKENKQFDQDLQQALGSAPTDPYQIMLTAARTTGGPPPGCSSGPTPTASENGPPIPAVRSR